MEFTVRSTTRNLNIPLKDLNLKSGILLAVIMRGREIIIPEGSSCLQEGDSVILISRGRRILDLDDIYEEEFSLPSPLHSAGEDEHPVCFEAGGAD